MINLDPNLLKLTRMKVLLYLNKEDKLFGLKHIPVDHTELVKFTAVNFRAH